MSTVFRFIEKAADDFLSLPDELRPVAAEMLDHLRGRLSQQLEVEGFVQYSGAVRILFLVTRDEVVVVDVAPGTLAEIGPRTSTRRTTGGR